MCGVFMKVEERVAAGYKATKEIESIAAIAKRQIDFKRKWRVRKAKKLLVERFGVPLIRMVTVYVVVVLLALVALIVVEATEQTHIIVNFHASFVGYFEATLVAITGLVGAVAAIVSFFKLAFASNMASSVSRGEVLFKEASMVKDQLGFLSKVKLELQELFDYLREFEEQVGTKIVIVPIIDDLDRCITDGRNVKVLEAMQLLLSVPGAPILSFLAVDSRIVVASIEDHYSRVFDKTNISGYEYIDKIVQIPFALPEAPPEKVKRLLSKSLEGDAASLAQVAQRLKVFGKRGRQILVQVGSSKQVTFNVARSRAPGSEAVVPLGPLVQAAKRIKNSQSYDTEETLKLVCAAAKQLGPYLEGLADQLIHRINQEQADQTSTKIYSMDKEEAVEVLCRETNAALESGSLGFEEVQQRKHPSSRAAGVSTAGAAGAAGAASAAGAAAKAEVEATKEAKAVKKEPAAEETKVAEGTVAEEVDLLRARSP